MKRGSTVGISVTQKMLKVYRYLYIQNGLLKKDFCRSIGVHQQNFAKYEMGILYCSLDVIYKIRSVYGVSLEWLIMGDPETDIVFC